GRGRNGVGGSWEVVRPFEGAIHTIPPIDKAVTKYGGAVQPMIRKTRHVRRSVATVIPEIGFDDDPISPVNRDDTVTNKNPKATIRRAPNKFPRRLSCGAIMIASSSAMMPPRTNFIERS